MIVWYHDGNTQHRGSSRIRNEKGENSNIAQKYINLAYEMGGDDWYGAEEIWDTAKFQERLVTLNLNK